MFWAGLIGPCGLSACSEADVATGCPACRLAVLTTLLLSKVACLQCFCQQRRRQSSLENVLINVSGVSLVNTAGRCVLRTGGWVNDWPWFSCPPLLCVCVGSAVWWRVCVTSQGTLSGTRVCPASPWWATRFWHVDLVRGCRWMDPHQSVKVS